MTTWNLNELLGISDEEWDKMTIEEKTLMLEILEQRLEEKGFLLEYDSIHGKQNRTLH